MSRPLLLAVGCFLAGLLIGWQGARGPRTVGPSRDSAALVAAAESLAVSRATLNDALAAARADSTAAAEALAVADALRRRRHAAPPLPSLPAPTAPPDVAREAFLTREAALQGRLAMAEEEADRTLASAVRYRASFGGAAQVAGEALGKMGVAEGRLNQAAHQVGTWHRAAVAGPRWSAGPVWEAGHATPVGGYVDRDAGPLRVRVEITDGPAEPTTARLALGVRFR